MIHDELYDPLQRDIIKYLHTFIKRKGDQEFHGGQWPDMADIAVYSSICSRDHSYHWVKFIDYAFSGELKSWYLKMKRICKFDENNNTIISLKESL